MNKKPSKFFTVCILSITGVKANRDLVKAVRITLRRKLNAPGHRKRMVQELKATGTTLDVKKYFYGRVHGLDFGLYAITLNKRRVYERLAQNKSRVYNFVSRKVLDQIPFAENGDPVTLIVDKSMPRPEINDFDSYVRRQLESRLPPDTSLDVEHRLSHEYPGIQAVDLFAWGIFQKYERQNTEWLDVFQDKIRFDDQYL